MVVKDKIGRKRYIILEKSDKIGAVMREIKKMDPSAKIIIKDERFILLRCKHWYKDEIIRILNENGVMTYRTTGTIKKAKKIMAGLN